MVPGLVLFLSGQERVNKNNQRVPVKIYYTHGGKLF